MDKTKKDKLIRYWKEGAKQSLQLAGDVLKKKYYDHGLFCGHLALEKLLKSKIVKVTDSYAPHSHDLLYLASLAKIDLTTEQQKFLAEVNNFNIEGRYPEEKLEFHRRITKNLAEKQISKINDFYLWLSKQSVKN